MPLTSGVPAQEAIVMFKGLNIAISDKPLSLLTRHDVAGVLLQEEGAAGQDNFTAVLAYPHRQFRI